MLRCLILISIILFSLCGLLLSETIYVDSNSGDDTSGDGTSGNPYKTFNKGYAECVNSDVIDLSGTFDWTSTDETGDSSPDGFTIAKNITIRGQGMSNTYVQAASTAQTADRRVFSIDGSAEVIVEDLTMRYGYVTSGGDYGGGILNEGTLTLNSCTVTDNENDPSNSNGYGRCITNWGSSAELTINNSVITNNTVDYIAGGIFTDGTLSINNSEISSNYCDNYGGGIRNWGPATLTNCTISNNQSNSHYGGGISNNSGTMTLENCTIDNNTANHGGGIFNGSTMILTNCTFFNNGTWGDGTRYGGAINNDENLTITNCTIASNNAFGYGGGIYNDTSGEINMKNTICANNTGYDDGEIDDDIYDDSAFNDNDYNIIETSTGISSFADNTITGDQTNLNLSSTLENNNSVNGTKTLKTTSGSVAIDAGGDPATGNNNGVTIPGLDQRGAERKSTTDIGAYEFWDDEASLPVELSSFTAAVTDNNEILIEWSTESAVDLYGFNLYRNQSYNFNNPQKINNDIIPGINGNSLQTYSYRDDNFDNSSPQIYYWLESVDLDQSTELFGPISISFSDFYMNLVSVTTHISNHEDINLQWTTVNENDILIGFDIYRNTKACFVSSEKINPETIYSNNFDNEYTYSFYDTETNPGNTFYYWIAGRSWDNILCLYGPFKKFIPNLELSYFKTEKITENNVLIKWETDFETELSGFNLFRESNNSAKEQLNNDIIIASNCEEGNYYDFIDKNIPKGNSYTYYLQSVNTQGKKQELQTEQINLEYQPQILGNFPNPFIIRDRDSKTSIKFEIKTKELNQLSIYNILGKKVKSFDLSSFEPGIHDIVWEGKQKQEKKVSSGIYFIKLKTKTRSDIHKMLIIK